MAIPLNLSEVPNINPYIQYVAGSGQTVFPYPFPITQDSDLIAVVNGVTLNTDSGYTLSGQGDDTGGNLTFTSGQTAGTIVTLYRDIPIERITQIGQNSGFSSTAFNAEFNNLYLIAQQLEASVAQCLQVPNTNNPAPVTTLLPTNYANKYLAFDAYGNPTPAALTSSGSITAALLGGLLYPQTSAEFTAGIIPVNPYVPSHDQLGYILLQRYGGSEAASGGTNSTAFSNAVLVAGQIDGVIGITSDGGTWNFSSPWSLSGSGQAFAAGGAPVAGAGAQGCRVRGFGLPVIKFSGIGSTTNCVTLGGTQIPQVELRNLQFNFNATGQDGIALVGSNKPILENLLIGDTKRDGLHITVATGTWVEKLRATHLTFGTIGRHAIGCSLSGTGFINNCVWDTAELRTCAAVTAGGTFMSMSATSPGAGCVVSNHVFLNLDLDCGYAGSGPVPGVSPFTTDSAAVQNFVLNGDWESTGGVSPGTGYGCSVTGSGSWSGLFTHGLLTNSLWGSGDGTAFDPAIAACFDFNYSFSTITLPGGTTIKCAPGTTALKTEGNVTGTAASDILIARSGSANAAIGMGPGLTINNTTTATFIAVQEYNGEAIHYVYDTVNGWVEGLRLINGINPGIQIAQQSTVYAVTGGAPSNTLGANGDFCLRKDGSTDTHIYFKASGTWTGII